MSDLAIRNRIKDHILVKGRDLQDHQGNWRVHPQMQRDALNGILAEVGIVDELIVYESERQGGLVILDGHLRAGEHPDVEWPCTLLDVTDQEADLILSTFDPLAAMAQADGQKLLDLVTSIQVSDQALETLRQQQKIEADLAILMAQAEEELAHFGHDAGGNVMGNRKPERYITAVICVEDVGDFERALLAAGKSNRSEAIMEICHFYLETHGGQG